MRLVRTGFGNVLGNDFAALGFSFLGSELTERAYDFSAHAGFRFWAKAERALKLRVNVTTMASRGTLQGGTCEGANCNDHFGVFAELTPTWAQYTVALASMTQRLEGWGKVVPKDLEHASSVDFFYVGLYSSPALTHDNPAAFTFVIDDVQLY